MRVVDRGVGLDLVPVTERAALAASRWIGRSDKNAADQAAVDAMRAALAELPLSGTIVIGEGEKDEAPMLYRGEPVGSLTGPDGYDIAVDPVDGTTLTSKGLPGAVAVLAASPRGTMLDLPAVHYMDKLVTGTAAADAVDIEAPVAHNVRGVARALGVRIDQVTVCVLDRPRHDDLVRAVCESGARVRVIPDGDVIGALSAAMDGTGVDLLLGVGGTPEGVVSACAVKCVGGVIQGRLHPRSAAEREAARAAGCDLDRVYTTDDLVTGPDATFVLTGVTDGDLVRGVHHGAGGVVTDSLQLDAHDRSVRRIRRTHREP